MKIICVGQNYPKHIKELNSKTPTEPVLFLKPDTSLLLNNRPFYLPSFSKNIHHEVELVVRINRTGKHIERKFAHRYFDEIGLGIDFTARDVQSSLKLTGLPWEKAKSFDFSAPISRFLPKEPFSDIQNISFSLEKNGELVQLGNTSEMLFSIDELISYISSYFTLKIGDLIFTGTPHGVSSVKIGDRLIGKIEDKILLDFSVK